MKQKNNGEGDKTRSISIKIDGEDYANLQRLADAMNSVGWCDNDNTPETIVKAFFWHIEDYRTMCDDVADGIDTGFADGTPQDHERKKALRVAFAALSPDDSAAHRCFTA